MKDRVNLYPEIQPYDSGFMDVDEHQVYYEQCGNPDGKPAVFLHGGPGGGGSEKVRRFFDPDIYRIVIFDQRGCGRSKPHGCLTNNTTWDLVSDIESLKNKLSIDKWLVFGGSWGSTLSLAYAQTHPDSVSEIVLRGIFLLRKEELHWFYQDGASKIFPEDWNGFLEIIDKNQRDDLMTAYHNIFTSDDEERRLKAAVAWSKWEAATSTLIQKNELIEEFSDSKFALAFALIENHYFINKGWFEEENQLINNIDIIRSIPSVIVQGRYDVVCPMRTAMELSEAWPEAEMIVAPSSGHSAFEEEITDALIRATDKFGSNS